MPWFLVADFVSEMIIFAQNRGHLLWLSPIELVQ